MQQQPTRQDEVRLAEVIATLSLATDLGMGQPSQYGLRSCLLAVRLGRSLGLGDGDLTETYYLALLRFAGCTADSPLAAAVFGDELAVRSWLAAVDYLDPMQMLGSLVRRLGAGETPLRRARLLANAVMGMPKLMETGAAHCEVAQRLAQRLGLGAGLQPALGQLYERWDGRGMPRGLKGEAIAPAMRVVHLAQDAETLYRLAGVEGAVAMARQRAGTSYDPHMAASFCQEAPHLLARSETESAWEAVLAAEPGPRRQLSGAQVDTALRAMADFVDLKSPYTGNHSSGVAALAAAAAQRCRLPAAEVTTVQRAAWLHDLGRVGVSSRVWEKTGPLTDDEWEQVRLHPYLTERVLSRCRAFAPLAALAAMHHERLDGSGYHRGLPAALLPVGARLLAAADAYHAMTEPRPHRPALTPEVAAAALLQDARAGRLDGEAVAAVLAAAGQGGLVARRVWPGGLSEREVEVLRLVARGLSKQQIAAQLGISRATADHHVRHIYEKIGVSTRAAATLYALQHDLVHDLAAAVVAAQ